MECNSAMKFSLLKITASYLTSHYPQFMLRNQDKANRREHNVIWRNYSTYTVGRLLVEEIDWQLPLPGELKNNTIKMVESSKVLRTPRTEKQTKIELFDALRQELESSVLEKASKAVQELILDQNGIGSDITETVEKVYCRLSGWDPPLFPTFNPNQRQRKREREREEIKGKEKENLDTALKKKKFNETNTEEGGDKGASSSSNTPGMS